MRNWDDGKQAKAKQCQKRKTNINKHYINVKSKKRMRRFTLLGMAMALAVTASAQWNTTSEPVLLSGDVQGTHSPKVVLTKDGKMYIAWRTAAKVGNALCYAFPHLQLIDKDGNAMFGKNGLEVSKHVSPSWTSDYSLVATSDGCAVVSTADSRSEESDSLDRYNTFTPVWYKIDQEQNYLWGLDGLALTDRISSPLTNTYVVGDDVWIQDNTSSYTDVNYFNRVSPEGTLGFAESQSIFGQILQSVGTDFIAVNSGSYGPEAMRYTRDCGKVWSEPVTFATNNYGGHSLHPYALNSDGKGGFYATWVRNMGSFSHMICTQHVDADGDPTFGLDAMDVYSAEELDHNYCTQAVDTVNNKALVFWALQVGGGRYDLRAQLFNEQGDRLFGDEGKIVATKGEDYAGWAFNNYGLLPVGDGEWLACYADVRGWQKEYLYVERFDKDCNSVWKKQIGEYGRFDDIAFLKGDDCSYVVFITENEDEYDIIKGARIYDDGSFEKSCDGISGVNEGSSAVASASIYSVDGKLVKTVSASELDNVSLEHGMYIVNMKDVNGKTKSIKISK